ncbi:MAG TPA: hypothetical protein ENI16_00995, partial [Candidatus Portnoybacteria bacterium]|nr:hypothetical protein [Candidatus Portnoybacteria bacterium]
AKQILQEILQEKKKIADQSKYILIHGDPGPKNIIVGPEKEIAFIDFGNSWRFDPLSDIGNFLVQIDLIAWRKYASQKYINQLKNIFLKEYFEARGIKRKEALKRIHLYQAWWAMQILAYTVVVGTKRMRIVKKAIPLAKKCLKEYKND